MIPELKGFNCLEHDPIDEWVPDLDDEVNYYLCLYIGLPDDIGIDYFTVNIVTPQAINALNLGPQLKGKHVTINPYSWDAVIERLTNILNMCDGDNWDQQLPKLREHFDWEYDGYRS